MTCQCLSMVDLFGLPNDTPARVVAVSEMCDVHESLLGRFARSCCGRSRPGSATRRHQTAFSRFRADDKALATPATGERWPRATSKSGTASAEDGCLARRS